MSFPRLKYIKNKLNIIEIVFYFPLINLSKNTITATTNKIWINPPAIFKANPPNHATNKIITIISISPIFSHLQFFT